MTSHHFAIAVIPFVLLSSAAWGAEGTSVLRNGDFRDTAGWGGLGSDDTKGVAVVTLDDGTKAILLKRKQAKAGVAVDQTVKLKPQTLYRLSATGEGGALASLRLRPFASTDKDFMILSKCWATSTAPFDASDKLQTMDFVFDSGLKVDSATVSVYLSDPKQLGDFTLRSISLTEVGSSKPAKDEIVVAHLGDSITITSYLPFHRRVDRLLDAMVAKEFPKLKVRQINVGADGEFVKDLLESGRHEKTVKQQYERLDVAFIRYGANDSRNGSPEDFKTQLAKLCEKMEADYPGIRIVLGTGTDLFPVSEGIRKQYGAWWQASRDLAKEKGYPLVDVFERFAKEQSADLCRKPGDMHPSARGVEVIADEEFKALKPILAEK